MPILPILQCPIRRYSVMMMMQWCLFFETSGHYHYSDGLYAPSMLVKRILAENVFMHTASAVGWRRCPSLAGKSICHSRAIQYPRVAPRKWHSQLMSLAFSCVNFPLNIFWHHSSLLSDAGQHVYFVHIAYLRPLTLFVYFFTLLVLSSF